MRTSRFSIPAVIALLAGLVQLTAGGAHAETATLSSPYASDHESCSGNGTCESAADAATGDLGVNALVVGEGTVVETIQNTPSTETATANVVAVHTLGTEADAINYTVNFDVLEGVAQTAGSVNLFNTPPRAEVRFVAWAQHRDCAECFAPQAVAGCVASWLAASWCTVSSGRLRLPIAVTNTGGGRVPAGTVEISAPLQAVVGTGWCGSLPGACEASASGHAIVANIAAESNNFPVAVNDSASGPAGSPVTINVLANDFDPDGDPLSVSLDWTVRPANGSAAVNPDQTVTYTPNGCFTGTDTFTYGIRDGKGGYDRGVVTVRLRKTRGSTGC